MKTTEILVRLKTAIYALSEAEKVAIGSGEGGHAERIAEIGFLLNQLYDEIKRSTNDPI